MDNSASAHALCADCALLAVDVVSGITLNDRWETMSSRNGAVSYAKTHLDGTISTLEKSAQLCPLCDLISAKVKELGDDRTASSYNLFLQQEQRGQASFKASTSDIKSFIEHVSQIPPSREIIFFGQLVHFSTQPELPTDRLHFNLCPQDLRLTMLPDPDLGSKLLSELASTWLKECLEKHSECVRASSFFPKRLLDLQKLNEANVVSLWAPQGPVSYASLSYSWGETDRLILKKYGDDGTDVLKAVDQERKPIPGRGKPSPIERATYSIDNIPRDAFPKTIRDALQGATVLGFRYLWVDSICIIQHGDNYEDWNEQSAMMTDIYEHSALNISATSTPDSIGGMLNPLKSDRVNIGTWPCEGGQSVVEVFIGNPLPTIDLEDEFLSSRGWVFQERLVSPATLHYTDKGMIWECSHGHKLPQKQRFISKKWKNQWRGVMRLRSAGRSTERTTIVQELNWNRIWCEWVQAYCERNLYDYKDKFMAIAGIARRLGEVSGFDYVAGIWQEHLLTGLLWRRHNDSWLRENSLKTLGIIRERSTAPSWSWAAVQGRIQFCLVSPGDSRHKSQGQKLRIEEIIAEESSVISNGSRSYGTLKSGVAIRVQGWLQRVTIDREKHPGGRQKPFQECGVSFGFVNNDNVLCMLNQYSPTAQRYEDYWCLRVGSYNRDGREGDAFLLLNESQENKNMFLRVGLLETDPWWVSSHLVNDAPNNSGVLRSPSFQSLTIV